MNGPAWVRERNSWADVSDGSEDREERRGGEGDGAPTALQARAPEPGAGQDGEPESPEGEAL
eukprot:13487741-Alexandrium_andersonii.AAC.1